LTEITKIRGRIAREVFDYQVLLEALSTYSKPRDKITRLLSSGAIVRIKKGLYCFSESLRREAIHREYVANLIYGPSYVSLDYALSYRGLIPERVETITSVTMLRSRDFETPLGYFSYRVLERSRYSLGAALESIGKTAFLMATAEKALADKVWSDKRISGRRSSDYAGYLSDDLRIEPEALAHMDGSRLQDIALAYDSVKINRLVEYLEGLRGECRA
jgi:predicted transcriptional regulator of viral defense system